MQLTPEQRESIEQQRKDNPEIRGIRVEMTEEQRREWRSRVDAEQAGKADNIERVRKIAAAANEPGFWGDLRRVIRDSDSSQKRTLAEQIGVDREVFEDFRAGEASLPSEALDRLIEALNLRLAPAC